MPTPSKYELRRRLRGPDGELLRDPATGKVLSEKSGEIRYRARYRGPDGKEHVRHFKLRRDAQAWLDAETAKVESGSWVSPKLAKITMGEWAGRWLETYATRKPSTVRMAHVHVAKIVEQFGNARLDSIKPSQVKAWTVALRNQGLADSYVYALHRRLSQLFVDAIHDGLAVRSPVSRQTAPPVGKARAYVATTDQVWQLHDGMDELLRPGLLLAAFAGLRLAEVCGLRVGDLDFMRGIVHPTVQYPAEPLKTEMSRTAVPIPHDLALRLSAHVEQWSTGWILSDPFGKQVGPWQLQREFRRVRETVIGLPANFRFHDLRHYYASLLISSGCDVKVVQARLRHSSAKTTLDTYGHLWPDSDETTRAAVSEALAGQLAPDKPRPGLSSSSPGLGVLSSRNDDLADYPRTREGGSARNP